MRKLLEIWAVLSLALVIGCGDKAKPGEPGTPAKGAAGKSAAVTPAAKSLLAGVPDDTPYIFANTAAMPKPFLDRVGVAFGPALKQLEAEMLKAEKELGDSPDDKLAKAFIAELKGNLNRAGMAKLGIDPDFRFVIHGVGVLPVARIALKDATAFKAMIARVEKNSGRTAPVAKQGNQSYYRFANDGMVVAVAVLDDQLVATFMPERAAAQVLPAVLTPTGDGKAVQAKLEANAKTYGLRASTSGFVDLAAVGRAAMGTGSALNNQIFATLTQGQMPPLSAACKTDYESLIKTWPGMALGYTELTDKSVKARYVVQVESGLAGELAGLRSAVPGLGEAHTGLARVGFGLDVEKTLAFLQQKAQAHQAKPYACENLGALNQMFGGMGLAQMLPPQARGLKGLVVDLKSMEMGGNGPGNIKATALVVMSKANELLTMAKGQVPPLANLNVKPDGAPVAFPAGLIPPVAENPHIAMTNDALAISIGKGEEAGLSALVKSKAKGATPILAISYDMQALMKMTNMQAEMRMAPDEKQVMDGVLGLVKDISYSVDFQKSGIVIEQGLVMP